MPSDLNHRITPHSEEDFDRLTRWIISLSCPTLIVRENTDKFGQKVRPHLHVYVRFGKTMSTYRQQFSLGTKSPFADYKGNSDHSIQERRKTDIENFRYLCKGIRTEDGLISPIVVYNNIINENDIKERQTEYWQVYDEKIASYAESKKKTISDDINNKTKKKPSWTEETIVHLRQIFADRGEEVHLNNPIHKQIIYMEMMLKLGKAAKAFDEMMFMRLMHAVENGLRPSHKIGIFYESLIHKHPIEFMAHLEYMRIVPDAPEIDMSGVRNLRKNK